MQQERQIILEVSHQAEIFYDDAVQLGDHAAYALGKKHRAQMTGLESVAESALKASDVWDYIKRQTGRFPYWQQPAPDNASFKGDSNKPFGERLRYYLEVELRDKRDAICERRLKIERKTETEEARSTRRRVYLLLIRHFVRQMVTEYEYQVDFAKEQEEGAR